MHRRLLVFVVALFILLALSPVAASPLAASQCFSVPGITNCVDGRFGSFWNGNGGLPVFGYPITPQRDEANADLQKTFSTQWFERNRFELHPENTAPYDVLLGRLGAELLQAQSRDWHNEPNNGNPLGGSCQHFNDTNRDVCGPFLTYWQGHGLQDPKLNAYNKSLALFGLPLTGVKSETNPNGDTVMTQWFERARFELHPEVGNIVLLGLLGKERQGGAIPPVPADPPIASTVLQLSDMPTGFTLDEAREISNDDAANASRDPAKARQAFIDEGRQTSYFARFLSQDYAYTGALGVSDQVNRYGAPEGAQMGQDFTIADQQSDPKVPGYQLVSVPSIGDRSIALRRTFTANGIDLVQFYFTVQQGRYLDTVQVIGLSSVLHTDTALAFVTKAVSKLPK